MSPPGAWAELAACQALPAPLAAVFTLDAPDAGQLEAALPASAAGRSAVMSNPVPALSA